MKAKLLLMLFLVSLSLGVFASEHHQKKPHAVCKVYEKVATRIPFIFSIQAEDINDCLYLTSQFSLNDADITMLDKDGNEKGVVMNNAFEKTAVLPKCDKGSAYSTQINLSF